MKETDVETVVLEEDYIEKMVKPVPPAEPAAEPTDSGSEGGTGSRTRLPRAGSPTGRSCAPSATPWPWSWWTAAAPV